MISFFKHSCRFSGAVSPLLTLFSCHKHSKTPKVIQVLPIFARVFVKRLIALVYFFYLLSFNSFLIRRQILLAAFLVVVGGKFD